MADAEGIPKIAGRGTYALVLAVGAWVLLRGLGSFGLWDPWEPLHAEAARELAARGWFAGVAEPPLADWGILLGSALFGRTELGVRFVGALAALVSMLALCYAVGRLCGRRAGLLAALVLGSSPLFYFLARQATPDIYRATATGVSLLFCGLAIFHRDERRLLHGGIGGAGLALALVSSGALLAVAAVLVPLAVYGLSRAGSEGAVPEAAPARIAAPPGSKTILARIVLLAAVLALAAAGAWYAAVLVRHGDPGVLTALQPAPQVDDQPGGFEYYLRGWIFGFFPWSCLWPAALVLLVSAWDRDSTNRGPELYLALSCACTFAVINFPNDRFPQALAPVVIPGAALLGITIDRLLRSTSAAGTRLAWGVAAMLYLPPMIDLARERGFRYLLGTFTTLREVPRVFDPGVLFIALLAAMALILLASILFPSRFLVGALAGAAVLLAGHDAGTLVPRLTNEKSMKGVFEPWRALDTGDAPIGFYGDLTPGVRFYAGPRLRPLADEPAFMTHMHPSHPAFAVVENERLLQVDRPYRRRYPGHRLYVVARSHSEYILLANHDVENELTGPGASPPAPKTGGRS